MDATGEASATSDAGAAADESGPDTATTAAFVECLIALGDDALVLGHRLSEWAGHAPMLEEDLSLPNMGLDLLGHARHLYTLAGSREGRGRDEDDFAFLRREREYRQCLLVERPNGDFARTVVRQLFFAAGMAPYWHAVAEGDGDAELRAIGARAVKELRYHVRHAGEWVIRLGDGTGESERRVREAVEALLPDVPELFAVTHAFETAAAAGLLPRPDVALEPWHATVAEVWREARLGPPPTVTAAAAAHARGRAGRHSESFGHLLAELQYLPRSYPGARW